MAGLDLLSSLRELLSSARRTEGVYSDSPLRAEIYGLDQLQRHARMLAEGQEVEVSKARERLLRRLRENHRDIRHCYQVVSEAAGLERRLSPAEDWLLDNYYLVEEQVNVASKHLPRGYSVELPRLRGGVNAGVPRVYDLALELIAHTDGQVDLGNLTGFLQAYQTVAPLKLGELWAVPIMLRLALLENIGRVSRGIEGRRLECNLAANWSERFISLARKHPKALITELAQLIDSDPPLTQAFVAEMATQVQGQHAALGLVVNWLEQELSERGLNLDSVLHSASQEEAAEQVSVGNSITSMRVLGAIDWRSFVEDLSVTEAALKQDPAGVYPLQDFGSRDRSRHVVEDLAKHSEVSEQEVARLAVHMAQEKNQEQPHAPFKQTHVGYYLLDRGRAELEKRVAYHPPLTKRLARTGKRHNNLLYFSLISLMAVLLTLVTGVWLWSLTGGVAGTVWGIVLLAILSTRASVSLADFIITLVYPPHVLPRLNFAGGIPRTHRTLVAVPCMLSGHDTIDALLDALEIRYLSNRDNNLYFALVTDFSDAPSEEMPADKALLDRAIAGIRTLNERYSTPEHLPFMLLHRPRKWSEGEQVWMGHERKRGKLEELNRLIDTGDQSGFSLLEADVQILRTFKHVLTLDADTQLPRESAWKLVAVMAHPLNRAQMAGDNPCVTAGYSLLQPRVALSLTGASRSGYAKLFSGEVGFDPYTRESSDAYQDLFAEGSFIGKGIYNVASFGRALTGRFPDNLILSHDLLEGCHARCGTVSDVELIEDYPSSYLADARRRHRWIRGDWQIIGWLLPWVPSSGPRRLRNNLSALSRWKIFDNLRRSLIPPLWLFTLIAAFVLLPQPAAGWFTGVLVITLMPLMVRTLWQLARKPRNISLLIHWQRTIVEQARQLAILGLEWFVLPHEAWINLHAIALVLWRKTVSKRNLLQWQTASDAERSVRNTPGHYFREMWMCPAVAVFLLIATVMVEPFALLVAMPLLLAWSGAPVVMWWLGRPLPARVIAFSEVQRRTLRLVARRTWHYFERFVTPDQNYLPPDNFQLTPRVKLAERTSPTNIGMGLLANVAALDFGYISASEMIDRTQQTFGALQRLERFRGHFYNWYSTRTAKAIAPFYVSSVDSGNLAGHLLTLRAALEEVAHSPVLPRTLIEGIEDTARIFAEEADAAQEAEPVDTPVNWHGAINELLTSLSDGDDSPHNMWRKLSEFKSALAALRKDVPDCDEESTTAGCWFVALEQQVQQMLEELQAMMPWAQEKTPDWDAMQSRADAGAELLTLLGQIDHELRDNPTVAQIAQLSASLPRKLEQIQQDAAQHAAIAQPIQQYICKLLPQLRTAGENAAGRMHELRELAQECSDFADMDFRFLYDRSRKLLSIGYHTDTLRMDPSFYDLMASEARLASYLAVANGQLPQEHWFSLGRRLIHVRGTAALVSWSGSMFEYLMPLLVMPTYPHTLLDQTYSACVKVQIAYARERNVPWGISESGYHLVDRTMNYQYHAFGVPALGLKRGLGDDLVIAPYASAMGLMVLHKEAYANIKRMIDDGLLGRYGLYEAVDYTPTRVPTGHTSAVVKSWMAHHSGMTLLSLDYALQQQPMQKRFLSQPELRAAAPLLHEKAPVLDETVSSRSATILPAHQVRAEGASFESATRVYSRIDTPAPEIHLLSNGRYHVMMTHMGGGFSRWQGLSVTRWREDATRDAYGAFCYVRDMDNNRTWSVTHQPTGAPADRFEAIFSQGRVEFRRTDGDIQTYTVVSVSSEEDVEIRRITLSNQSDEPRTVELTSYAEVVMADAMADASHPAFSNLFVQTKLWKERAAILCTRRARSSEETPPYLLHMLLPRVDEPDQASFETDRAQFIGRGRDTSHPLAMQSTGELSNSQGSVLDPVVSIRRTVTIPPRESVNVDYILGMAATEDIARALIEKFHDRRLADRVFEVSWTHSQVLLQHLRASEPEAQLFSRLASPLLYVSPRYRAAPSILARNRKSQPGLWSHGISGDLPIVLLQISDPSRSELMRQAVQAHAYWRAKGLRVDLVILTDEPSGYRQSIHDQIMGLLAGTESHTLDQPGGIFVRDVHQVPEEDRQLLQAMARVVLTDQEGTLLDQAERRLRHRPMPARLNPTRPAQPHQGPVVDTKRELLFSNDYGGFTPDGREYVTILGKDELTPAPWSNVIANPRLGSVITESGSSYTWYANAREYRLTPWHNDPVSETAGECFYLRDEETGEFWSPSPLPAPSDKPYICRHGLGYTVFEHAHASIFCTMTHYVPMDAPVKLVTLKLKNQSDQDRRISATAYVEWVLGDLREKNAMHVVTRQEPRTGALIAHNTFNTDFADKVAFIHANQGSRSFTGDRTEFLGRGGTTTDPAAMYRTRLSNRVSAGVDPCGALQVPIDVPAGQERSVTFILGAADSEQEVFDILQRFQSHESAYVALTNVWESWKNIVGAINVVTPDDSFNIMVNNWLIYQTLACRIWGRSGFYQSGGAFGFRDQLQDAMALLHTQPQLLREHLLTSASRQFVQGDVQHWWHPPSGKGVRTHFSDDYLWLPYATARYVRGTADTGVLDEKVGYLEARPVREDEESYYDLPARSELQEPLYQHCIRAIKYGLKFGQHGLPLMGCGDWNDGMNRVGHPGKGESVWLAFFLYDVLQQFIPIAQIKRDEATIALCKEQMQQLSDALEKNGWDGQWYRRAYFGDGTPLGSLQNTECQIDSLPQSWARLSGAGSPERAAQGMAAVDKYLVRDDLKLIQLFDPPFDKAPQDPGYIKGYVPGVRENGGQYTHAAIWAVMAVAKQRDIKKAWKLMKYLNPIHHGDTRQNIDTYKVEPYSVAADIYTNPEHPGRGGWTWYTGSAGWMYRLMVESLLGIELVGQRLRFTPVVPPQWKSYVVHYRYRSTVYHITFKIVGEKTWQVRQVTVDNVMQPDRQIHLADDLKYHTAVVELG